MSFDMDLAFPSHVGTEAGLAHLEKILTSNKRIIITYGGRYEHHYWRCTDFSFTSNERTEASSSISNASISVSFIKDDSDAVPVGPVSGGVHSKPKPKPTKKKKSTTSSTKKKASKTRYYTIKKGDTLSKISIKLYHTASKWRYLATLNKLKNPNKIYPGKKLKY